MIDTKDSQGFVEAFLPTPKYEHEELEVKKVEGATPTSPTFSPSKVTREGLGLPEAAPLKEGVKKPVSPAKIEQDAEIEDALKLLGNISLSDMRMNKASWFNPENSTVVNEVEEAEEGESTEVEVGATEEPHEPAIKPTAEAKPMTTRQAARPRTQKLQGINSTNTPESALTIADLGKITPIKAPEPVNRTAIGDPPQPSFMKYEPVSPDSKKTMYDKFKDLDMSTPKNRAASLSKIANAFGIPEKAFVGIASIESSMGTHTRPSKKPNGDYVSSAKGMYQILNKTWDDILKQTGAHLGIKGQSRDDHVASALAAAYLLKDNKRILGKYYEEPVDLYLAHFMGAGAAKVFKQQLWVQKKTKTYVPAASLFAAAAGSNPEIFYKDPKTKNNPRTLGEIRALFNDKLTRGAAAYGYI